MEIDEVLNQDFWDRLQETSSDEALHLLETLQRRDFEPVIILRLLPAIREAAEFTENLRETYNLDDREAARPILVDTDREEVLNNLFGYDVSELEREGRYHVGVETIFPDEEPPVDPSKRIPAEDESDFYLFFPPENR